MFKTKSENSDMKLSVNELWCEVLHDPFPQGSINKNEKILHYQCALKFSVSHVGEGDVRASCSWLTILSVLKNCSSSEHIHSVFRRMNRQSRWNKVV